jgi:hypothetical protein
MLAFLFVSLKVGEKLDTRRSRSSHPLRQDDDYIKIHSLVVLETITLRKKHPSLWLKKNHEEAHHCHHVTRWTNNGEDLKPKETRCNSPKTTRSRSSTYSDQFTRSFCSHQFLHNLKGEQQVIFGYLEAP